MSKDNLPATQQQQQQQSPAKIRHWLSTQDARTMIESALGDKLSVDKFISQMVIAFEKNPEVARCSAISKFECANICATLGLLPTLGEVALIPRAGILTVMPQWQGFNTLMLRNKNVKSLKARIIHRLDKYEFDATTETLTHEYDPFIDGRTFHDWKDVKGGYLVIEYNDGRPALFHCVSVDTMKQARGCAQSDNVWKKWFYEQLLKTVYRNAFARRVVPMDLLGAEGCAKLVEVIDEVEENDPDRAQSTEEDRPKPLSRVEQIKAAKTPERKPDPTPEPEPEVIDTEVSEQPPEGQDAEGEKLDRVTRVMRILKKEIPDRKEQIKTLATWGVTEPFNLDQWTDAALDEACQYADQLELAMD